MVTRDPFSGPWKKADVVLREAHARGYRTLVALDDRTDVAQCLRVGQLADDVRRFTGESCEDALGLVSEVGDDWVLRIDDDEEPSDLCWRLGLEPPFLGVIGVPVIPVLGEKIWRRDIGIQDRLFPAIGWRWEGGFNGKAVHPYRTYHIGANPGVIIWHYYPEAPREEREAKAARYEALGPGDHRSRLIWEEHPEGVVDMPAHIAIHRPKKVRLN